jgi:hypothetical protein
MSGVQGPLFVVPEDISFLLLPQSLKFPRTCKGIRVTSWPRNPRVRHLWLGPEGKGERGWDDSWIHNVRTSCGPHHTWVLENEQAALRTQRKRPRGRGVRGDRGKMGGSDVWFIFKPLLSITSCSDVAEPGRTPG